MAYAARVCELYSGRSRRCFKETEAEDDAVDAITGLQGRSRRCFKETEAVVLEHGMKVCEGAAVAAVSRRLRRF